MVASSRCSHHPSHLNFPNLHALTVRGGIHEFACLVREIICRSSNKIYPHLLGRKFGLIIKTRREDVCPRRPKASTSVCTRRETPPKQIPANARKLSVPVCLFAAKKPSEELSAHPNGRNPVFRSLKPFKYPKVTVTKTTRSSFAQG